jgi:hypothetical protein
MGARLDGELIRFGYLASLVKSRWIPPGRAVSVLEITLCLQEGTAAGRYPLTLETGELIDYESARAIQPALVSGALTVASDVTAGVECEDLPPAPPPPAPPPPPPPPPPPAGAVQVVYGLADVIASPGDTVSMPFNIRANLAVQGYEFSVDFDEGLLQATEVEQVWEKPDYSDPEYSYAHYDINNSSDTPGNGGVDEGYITGGVVFSMVEPVNLPVDVDNEVLRFRFLVDPETPAATTRVRFADGGQNAWGRAVPNAITGLGMTIPPELAESFIFIDSSFHVQPDIVVFIRGDSNGDDEVEMSDAVTTLNFLFLGSERPHCYDAADANDDGALNIADPVFTLQYLFLGGAELPAPFPDAGEDPTDDGMSCRSME